MEENLDEIKIDSLKKWIKRVYPELLEYYENNQNAAKCHIRGYLHATRDHCRIKDEIYNYVVDFLNMQ